VAARNENLSDRALIDLLAEQVLGWRVAPERFMTEDRSWLPRWRFNPLERLDDAFVLLDRSLPARYQIAQAKGEFQVEVESNGRIGTAAGSPKARIITFALARSLGLEV
jgi:hypothetical protein